MFLFFFMKNKTVFTSTHLPLGPISIYIKFVDSTSNRPPRTKKVFQIINIDSLPNFVSRTKQQIARNCLVASIIKYGSRVSGAIQGNKRRLPLHLGVVAIEERAFGLPRQRLANLIYTYFLECYTFIFW